MLLEGSCHCRAVRFSLTSQTPYPYMLCYCTICRKTDGGGGFAINIMGLAETLVVKGEAHLSVYRARLEPETQPGGAALSEARRHFCALCASALWLSDPRWPQWVWPFASAIDTELPVPPSRVHMMENYRCSWATSAEGNEDAHFGENPAEAIIDWHQRRGLFDPA